MMKSTSGLMHAFHVQMDFRGFSTTTITFLPLQRMKATSVYIIADLLRGHHAKQDRNHYFLLINCVTWHHMRTLCNFGSNYAFAAGDHNLWTALQVSFFKFFSCAKRLQMYAKHNFEARSLFSYSSFRHTQTIKICQFEHAESKKSVGKFLFIFS